MPVPRSRGRTVLVFIVIVALVAAAAGAWFLLRANGPGPAERGAVLGAFAASLGNGIHVLGATAPNASYVVETADGYVLVDTCKEADAMPIVEQMESRGLDVARLKMILLTHCHCDHVLGARRLREMTNAKVYAGRGDADVIRAGGPREAMVSVFHMPLEMHKTPVDVELAGGEVIEFGGVTIEAIATPGHSPGSICYLVTKNGRTALFSGDVIASLNDSNPLVQQGVYTAFLSPRYRGDALAYLQTLEKLRAMPAPGMLLPGHFRDDALPESPAIGAAGWTALLDGMSAKLKNRLARYETDGRDFLDGRPRNLLPGLVYFGEFAGSAVYALVTVENRCFLIDAPGGAELLDFVNAGFRAVGVSPIQPEAVLLTSCEAESTSGLAALVAATNCEVVAPAAEIERLRALCPPETKFRTSDELAKADWFPVDVVLVAGRGTNAAVYFVKWTEKLVAFTGRTPTMMGPETDDDLIRAVAGPNGSAERFIESLERLEKYAPALWLPSRPVFDQAANVYDSDWTNVLKLNHAALVQ